MKTQINEKYRIVTDDDNFIIQSKVTPKKKDTAERWKNEGYFADMGQCALELLNLLSARSHASTEDVSMLIEEIRKAKKEILSALKKY